MHMKIALFSIFSLTILLLIGLIFWEQEYKFSLPTPVPANHVKVSIGDSVDISFANNSKPNYIHFYNYDCPCSRFNEKEFQSLVKKYSAEVNFIAVLETSDLEQDDIDAFKKKYDLGIRIIEDSGGKIAGQLGVYSTPQAVITNNQKVFYKGNYNKARFCMTKNTKFAEKALFALMNNEDPPTFPSVAYTPYGCELPSNTKDQQPFFSFLNL